MSTNYFPVQMDNETTLYIEAISIGGETDVAFEFFSLKAVSEVIEKMANTLIEPIRKVGPTKASLELNLAFGIKSGQLVTLWVNGETTANVKITLEWENQKSDKDTSNGILLAGRGE